MWLAQFAASALSLAMVHATPEPTPMPKPPTNFPSHVPTPAPTTPDPTPAPTSPVPTPTPSYPPSWSPSKHPTSSPSLGPSPGPTLTPSPTFSYRPTPVPSMLPVFKCSVSTCSELGWKSGEKAAIDTDSAKDSLGVCGASKDAPLADCSGLLTFRAARAFCEDAGARLCTKKELRNDETYKTGCNYDIKQVWSSTPCGGGINWLVAYGGTNGGSGSECVSETSTYYARCCADEYSCAPTPLPTSSLVPSEAPSQLPTMNPSPGPSRVPSSWPTLKPSPRPTPEPSTPPSSRPSNTPCPSPFPTKAPTESPSQYPTKAPTSWPSLAPSLVPSAFPTLLPSEKPSFKPTPTPSFPPRPSPSNSPTLLPTLRPSPEPSVPPSMSPSSIPSAAPSPDPSLLPTSRPTPEPSLPPSTRPSPVPSPPPTASPTQPSPSPSARPTLTPTSHPTAHPTQQPTPRPSDPPSLAPSPSPVPAPTPGPSLPPSSIPSPVPSPHPTAVPTQPSPAPSARPTSTPTSQPTAWPTEQPTPTPSDPPSPAPSPLPFPIPSPIPSRIPSLNPSISYKPSQTPVPWPTPYPTSVPAPTGSNFRVVATTIQFLADAAPTAPKKIALYLLLETNLGDLRSFSIAVSRRWQRRHLHSADVVWLTSFEVITTANQSDATASSVKSVLTSSSFASSLSSSVGVTADVSSVQASAVVRFEPSPSPTPRPTQRPVFAPSFSPSHASSGMPTLFQVSVEIVQDLSGSGGDSAERTAQLPVLIMAGAVIIVLMAFVFITKGRMVGAVEFFQKEALKARGFDSSAATLHELELALRNDEEEGLTMDALEAMLSAVIGGEEEFKGEESTDNESINSGSKSEKDETGHDDLDEEAARQARRLFRIKRLKLKREARPQGDVGSEECDEEVIEAETRAHKEQERRRLRLLYRLNKQNVEPVDNFDPDHNEDAKAGASSPSSSSSDDDDEEEEVLVRLSKKKKGKGGKQPTSKMPHADWGDSLDEAPLLVLSKPFVLDSIDEGEEENETTDLDARKDAIKRPRPILTHLLSIAGVLEAKGGDIESPISPMHAEGGGIAEFKDSRVFSPPSSIDGVPAEPRSPRSAKSPSSEASYDWGKEEGTREGTTPKRNDEDHSSPELAPEEGQIPFASASEVNVANGSPYKDAGAVNPPFSPTSGGNQGGDLEETSPERINGVGDVRDGGDALAVPKSSPASEDPEFVLHSSSLPYDDASFYSSEPTVEPSATSKEDNDRGSTRDGREELPTPSPPASPIPSRCFRAVRAAVTRAQLERTRSPNNAMPNSQALGVTASPSGAVGLPADVSASVVEVKAPTPVEAVTGSSSLPSPPSSLAARAAERQAKLAKARSTALALKAKKNAAALAVSPVVSLPVEKLDRVTLRGGEGATKAKVIGSDSLVSWATEADL